MTNPVQAIDGSIFNFNSGSNEFKTQTDDLLKAGTYSLRLTVRYDGDALHYTNTDTLDFNVELVNPCIAADLTIDANILSSNPIQYEVFDTAHIESFE